MSDEQQPKIKFDGVQMIAGALTAVTSAVLLSTVGVAGTLIGVAVGSVLGTVGNAVYSHYLALSKRRVAAAKVLAESRNRRPVPLTGDARRHEGSAQEARVQAARAELANAEVDPEAARRGGVAWREALSGLPWRRIVPIVAVVFVISLGAILVFELAAGRAISSYTGGTDENTRTTISGISRDSDRRQQPDRDRRDREPSTPQQEQEAPPAPGTTPTPTDAPAPSPTPTDTPEPEPTPEPPAPLEETEVPTEPTPEPQGAPDVAP